MCCVCTGFLILYFKRNSIFSPIYNSKLFWKFGLTYKQMCCLDFFRLRLVVRGLLFCDWHWKPCFTACSKELWGREWLCPTNEIQQVSIKLLHRLFREWVFLLISLNVASCCHWLARPGRGDGWICHRLVNCAADLSLTSGLWLLNGSIQNKLADCSHISPSICSGFAECSP